MTQRSRFPEPGIERITSKLELPVPGFVTRRRHTKALPAGPA